MKNRRTSLLVIATVLSLGLSVAEAQTYTPLYTYPETNRNNTGVLPPQIMSQGRDGLLYSTIVSDGTTTFGTVYKMTTSGTPTTVYTFCPAAGCADGQSPVGGVTLGMDGNFYGTTTTGGSKNEGTIFKLTPAGHLTTLWNFDAGVTEGDPTYAPLLGQDGNFYGVDPGVYAGTYGVLYRSTPAGQVTVSATFNYTNGALPNAPTQGTDGNFYGTTELGGSKGLGVVYKMTPAGILTVLHNFTGFPSDGTYPVGVLAQGNDGNFYGLTYEGGASNIGSVFKISASGTYTMIHSFVGVPSGGLPLAGLTVGSDGGLYGTTSKGGTSNTGTLFQVTTAGAVTELHSFCSVSGCSDGIYPETAIVQHTNGKFYGNSSGNSLCCGVFYSLDMGLAPFARLVNWTGKVGKSVEILGQGFTGTTKVSFNGTSAPFTVVSDTYLTATVPSGATTGSVTVTTPGGERRSSRKFLVTPAILSFSPTSGAVGSVVTITGTSFTGATRVTFGGVRATTFTVTSDSQITAAVPSGAVTGKIQVATPGGTANSSTSFTVTP